MAAHNWRLLRDRGLEKGIGDVMAVPLMHPVLDLVERIGLEASASGAKSENEARMKVNSFYSKIYRPEMTVNEDGEVDPDAPPAGWDDDDGESSFDAFLSVVD